MAQDPPRTGATAAGLTTSSGVAPDDAEINQFDQAMTRLRAGDAAGAANLFRAIVARRPDHAAAHNNLGLALRLLGDLPGALAAFRSAAAHRPELAQAVVNAALILLLLGRYDEAWPGYEWRRRLIAPTAGSPTWEGGDLGGRVILLHAEPGLAVEPPFADPGIAFGDPGISDAILLLRYVPLIAAQARRVILKVPRTLLRVAASLPAANLAVVAEGRAPPHDLHCALASLPGVFATRPDRIAGRLPSFTPRRAIVERWAHRLGAVDRLKVGLVTAGRSGAMSAADLAPLFSVHGVAWYGLHAGLANLASAPGGMVDLAPDITDLMEATGAILNLDLVVAVDSALAHLTGALARPGWIMLPVAPTWPWMLARDDTPWYPSLRLYRQSAAGDWGKVTAGIAAGLTRLAARHAGRSAPPPGATR